MKTALACVFVVLGIGTVSTASAQTTMEEAEVREAPEEGAAPPPPTRVGEEDAGLAMIGGAAVAVLGFGLEVGLYDAGIGGDEYGLGMMWAPTLTTLGTTILTLAVAWLAGLSVEESAYVAGAVSLVAGAVLGIVAGVAASEPGGILGTQEDVRFNRAFLLTSTAGAYGLMAATCFVIPFL